MKYETKSKQTFFYVKPVMLLGNERRYVRLTPEEAADESKKPMYSYKEGEVTGIVRIHVRSPYDSTYIVIFVEHPQIQGKTVADICDDWINWFNESCWQLGFEEKQIKA